MKRKDLKPGTIFKYVMGAATPRWVPTADEMCPPGCVGSYNWVGSFDKEVIILDSTNFEKPANPDLIDPNHYKNRTPEPIDVTEGWDLNANLASVIWYIARAGHKSYTGDVKSDTKTDLLKARQFLSREIARLEGRRSWE